MNAIFKKFYQILIALIVVLMTIVTLTPIFTNFSNPSPLLTRFLPIEQFYHSWLNLTLWALICLALLGVALFGKSMSRAKKVLHLMLALIFLLVGYDKITDRRTFIILKENQVVNLYSAKTNTEILKLRLLNFTIQKHPDQQAVAQYRSQILINERDTVYLEVNHPLALGQYRFFQNSYQERPRFTIVAAQDTFHCLLGDSALFRQNYLTLKPSASNPGAPTIWYNGKTYLPNAAGVVTIDNQPLSIRPAGHGYISIIEVVRATEPKILMIFGIFYLICLAYVLWWNP